MTIDPLLSNIFRQQLTLAQEMRKRLEGMLDDALEQAFDANEVHLTSLLDKSDVSNDDLARLQNLWNDLNTQLSRLKLGKASGDEEEKTTITSSLSQRAMSKLYSGEA